MINKETFAKYKEMTESIIQKYGHFVQGVGSEKPDMDGFMYTVGRNDKNKPDVYLNIFENSLGSFINEAADKLDDPDFIPGEIYESKNYELKKSGNEKSKYKLIEIDPLTVVDKCLGIFNRGKSIENIKIYQLILADSNNKFYND